jgi:hypothetical protein
MRKNGQETWRRAPGDCFRDRFRSHPGVAIGKTVGNPGRRGAVQSGPGFVERAGLDTVIDAQEIVDRNVVGLHPFTKPLRRLFA